MKRLRLPLSLALLCVFVALAVPMPAAAGSKTSRMTDGINWARAYWGLPTLHKSRRLHHSAERRASRLMRRDYFAHPATLRVASFERVGEVLELHAGRRARIRRTLLRWGRSPGHRSVLMSRSYGYIGAGKATGWYRGQRATIWVVRLGRK